MFIICLLSAIIVWFCILHFSKIKLSTNKKDRR